MRNLAFCIMNTIRLLNLIPSVTQGYNTLGFILYAHHKFLSKTNLVRARRRGIAALEYKRKIIFLWMFAHLEEWSLKIMGRETVWVN